MKINGDVHTLKATYGDPSLRGTFETVFIHDAAVSDQRNYPTL